MKKFDLHVHTKSTNSDAAFKYSFDKLQEYVDKCKLDCIAITNHNCFDMEQYEEIKAKLNICVLPGIEINVEGGHLLLISDNEQILDFDVKCKSVSNLIKSPKDSICVDKLKEIFGDLKRYLIIPHYHKSPCCTPKVITELKDYIEAGEVKSVKQFIYCQKDSNALTPVYFSDIRIKEDMDCFSIRQTYFDIDDIKINSIKLCLRDKNKVQLSEESSHKVFQVLENGLKISTGLTVILGERSSGKSHTLDEIYDKYDNVKYVKQFSLLETDEAKDAKRFNELLEKKQSSVSDRYLKEFKSVVEDVREIDLMRNEKLLEEYVNSLLNNAKDMQREDSFSKTNLFSEIPFDEKKLEGLKELIDAITTIADNLEYKELINSFISEEQIYNLVVALMQEYTKNHEQNLKKRWINEVIKDVQNGLKIRTSATVVKDIDFYQVLLEKEKVKRFKQVVDYIKSESIIESNNKADFKVVATASQFNSAGELKSVSGKRCAFKEAFKVYENPYDYLQQLKEIEQIPTSDYYKYFSKVTFKILNKYGYEVSGGERSEFNLLNEINDATQYDMLLLDEPESSFDNLFLKNNVNEIIKELSQNVPVVVVTHNNTVGASIKPDYIIFTKKEILDGNVNYEIYSGYPANKALISLNGQEMSNHNIFLDCLEAGENAYDERRRDYEMLKD